MNFLSDTTAPAHPALIEAIAAANTGFEASYGADAISARVEARLKDIFETVQRVNKEGMTVLLVEQNANLALQIAHRVVRSAHPPADHAGVQECW